LDAKYIVCNRGKIQIGTETKPYSK